MKAVKCKKCGSNISWLRVAAYWPTNIKCGKCSQRHFFRFGHMVGLIYLAFFIPLVLLPVSFASRFSNVENGIHSTSFVQLVVQYGSAVVVFLLVGLIYSQIIIRVMNLHAK